MTVYFIFDITNTTQSKVDYRLTIHDYSETSKKTFEKKLFNVLQRGNRLFIN